MGRTVELLNMKTFLLCLLAVSVATAWPHYLADQPLNDEEVDDLAHRQQIVNRLLYKVTENITYPDLRKCSQNFDPLARLDIYDDHGVAAKTLMQELKDHRLLKQHHWFSLFNERQRHETLMLFDILMACKEFHCVRHNAAFFRERMNEGEFVYALYTALYHSKPGKGIVLPPLYEVTPHMFTNSEVIQQAYKAQMTQIPGEFAMDFTGSKRNTEQQVAYFGEDIGMNVHHVTWHMDYPFWWDDNYGYHLDCKGELFFWAHHQLTVRFDAERLSNHLDMVEELYWDRPIVEGFAPHTTYRYGGEFPTRPDNVAFADVEGIVRVRDMIIMESRIRDAIAHGYITAADGSHVDIMNAHGIDHLGDIIESSLYSPNVQYYGALHNSAHILLGRQSDPRGKFNLPPSVMEHFETATRDPAFFRLHKYMDGIFKEHKDTLHPYTKEDVHFPGVHLRSVNIDGDLETHFEDFIFDLDMAVDTGVNEAIHVKAKTHRLNHHDFSYNFNVQNDNDVAHAVFRVFLCPRRDNNGILFSLSEVHWHCIELDKFWKKLSKGENKITRKSSESSVTVKDIPTFSKLIKEADEAVSSGSDLHDEDLTQTCGIPNRMLLPKGNRQGMEFTLAVAVTDGTDDEQHDTLEHDDHLAHSHCGITGKKYPDHQPMGFPLDRKIVDERVFYNADNIDFSVVKIYHKDDH